MTAAENLKRTLDLESLKLLSGAHNSAEQGMCVMEAVAFVAGEEHSDHPQCASEVIGSFLRTWNDCLDDEGRQKLKPYIPRLVGTKASKDIEQQRGWLAADWYIRHYTPAWLELAGLKDQADAVRALAQVADLGTLRKAQKVLDVASEKSSAAWSAAWSAAESAAWSAAESAAESAAA
jgi:hypothetical protein